MEKGKAKWLLLMHHLPPQPDYLRVKVRRRLARLGAIQLKPSVYVLPHDDDNREDLHWLRREISADGGEAIVCEATILDGMTDANIRNLFREQTSAEYRRITDEAAGKRMPSRLRGQLEEAMRLDFFKAPGRREAARAVGLTEAEMRETETELNATSMRGALPAPEVWVTRRGVKVDRMSSAWLIRRYIDKDARFKFVAPDDYEAAPRETQFDMYDGEYTHEGDRCTFEVLAARNNIRDRGVKAMMEIIHDLDMKDGKYGRAECAGVAAAIAGIGKTSQDDMERIERGMILFDALHAALQSA